MPPWPAARCEEARKILGDVPEFNHAGLDPALRAGAERLKIKAGQMFQPIRVAVCGRKDAPPLFETLEVLGRETASRESTTRLSSLRLRRIKRHDHTQR